MKGDRKSTRLNSSHTEIYTLSLHDALPISSKGVVHIFPQIRSKWARKLGHLRRKVPIHPRQHEGYRLAEVPDHDLQLGMSVEHPAEDHAYQMDSGLDVPAPTGGREHAAHGRRKAAVKRVDDRLRWNRRMQIDRDIECLGALEDRREKLVVQIAAEGVAIDERAFEA